MRPPAPPSNCSAVVELAEFVRRMKRRARGADNRSSSRRFAVNSDVTSDTPVAFPPGRARLAARPAATGSPARKTTGSVVASNAARAAGVLNTTSKSTFERARSAAIERSASGVDPAAATRGRRSCPRCSQVRASLHAGRLPGVHPPSGARARRFGELLAACPHERTGHQCCANQTQPDQTTRRNRETLTGSPRRPGPGSIPGS